MLTESMDNSSTPHTTSVRTTDTIALEPSEFGDVKKNIYNKIHKKMGSCNKEYGYIIDITDIIIDRNIICRYSGNCLYDVEYSIQYLKPSVNDKFLCEITSMSNKGIYCKYSTIVVFIPSLEIENRWTCKNKYYQNNITQQIIRVGDKIMVKLTVALYENKSFSCIGVIAYDMDTFHAVS